MKKLILIFVLISFKLLYSQQSVNSYILGAVNPAGGACLETDVFTNSNGTVLPTHNSNWYNAVTNAGMEIQSNQVEPLHNDEHASGNTGCSWSNNQYAEIITVDSGANGTIGAAVRVGGAGNGDYYGYYIGQTTIHQLFIMNGGSWTELASDLSPPADGSVIRLEISGTSLQGKDDGVNTLSATNSTHTTGDPGIAAFAAANNIGDNWEGGDL